MAAALAAGLALILAPRLAAADPQTAHGLAIGGAAVGANGEFWDHGEFYLGVHSDVLFLREEPWDFGLGPYLDVGVLAFDELQVHGGASALLPVDDKLPLVVSAGGLMRVGDGVVEPGVTGAIFWGSRSYNYHSPYNMAVGLELGVRQSLGDSKETAVLVAARLDLALMAMPVILLINAARGPTEEAEEIE